MNKFYEWKNHPGRPNRFWSSVRTGSLKTLDSFSESPFTELNELEGASSPEQTFLNF